MTRTLGRTLLLAAAVFVMFHGRCGAAAPAPAAAAPPAAAEESAMGRILEFQKKLNERIDYELVIPSTLDKVLDELLEKNGIPYHVNSDAFLQAQQTKDVVQKTPVEKIDTLPQVKRSMVFMRLLELVPSDGGDGTPTYVLRPDYVEITTRAAVKQEFYPGRLESRLPPLAYASFKEKPLRSALADLARNTERSIILDPKSEDAVNSKLTAEFVCVPVDTAVQVLAEMSGLKLIRLENVYYVTSPPKADLLRQEANRRRRELEKAAKKANGDSLDPLSSTPSSLPVIP